jgi:hypothetical protein
MTLRSISSRRLAALALPLALLLAVLTTACGRQGGEAPQKPSAQPAATAATPPPASGAAHETTPPAGGEGQLPPGHPPIEGGAPGAMGTIQPPPIGAGAGDKSLTWEVPGGWTSEVPKSAMRRAQYRVSGPGGDGECVVFYFGPGEGGAPQDNAMRWASQFELADGKPATEGLKTTESQVGTITVLRVEVAGTYHGGGVGMGGPSEPQPNYMLLGAVAEGPDANWFFKFTGPKATVEANRAAFQGMIGSLKPGA